MNRRQFVTVGAGAATSAVVNAQSAAIAARPRCTTLTVTTAAYEVTCLQARGETSSTLFGTCPTGSCVST